MKKITTGIIGAAGYTGGELMRILLRHPQVELTFAHSRSNAGKSVALIHEDLLGDTDLEFSGQNFSSGFSPENIDLLFLCAGHGEAKKFMTAYWSLLNDVRVIDLSHDYRLSENNIRPSVNGIDFVYGLPEINREAVRQAQYVANPGCFATAIQLGLLPLAKAGLLNSVYTTGITGSTGAGQSLSATSHFSWRANNIQAYKTLTHQHVGEIMQSLHQLQPDLPNDQQVNFVPWRGDFTRGIFVSSQLNCELPVDDLYVLYERFYATHPFVAISRNAISMKQVINTNKCVIQIEKSGNNLVVHSAIDNLVKGASGQAVQNMNLMFGLNETLGLTMKATGF